ncbi:hypothetical protein D9C73_013059 [Collichthys lucidus]|uniref:Uncharacterized protein n=1 Tax=Collichthys lucidus TaxID=240159 RepID=A0A4U5UWK7_COLLU|nr:hypothetical protein D9C73_013059 [Collichthys lucidus]
MTSLHRLRLSPLIQPLPRASLSIPPSTATAAPPAPTQTTAASTATHGGTFSQTPFFPPPFPPPFPYPYPPPSHNPHVTSISVPTSNVPLPSTAPPPAGSCSFPLYPPLPSNHSLATATPPARPTASPRPSPVSSALRQQILAGNYVDLAQLIHPSTHNPHIPRELQTALGTFQLKQPLTTHSKELTAPEFTLAFSLYRDVICPAFPDRRSEPDDYLSLIIDLASRFGGNGFYSYDIPFTSQALLLYLRSTSIPPLRSMRRTITSSHHLLHHHSAIPYFSPTKSQPGSF